MEETNDIRTHTIIRGWVDHMPVVVGVVVASLEEGLRYDRSNTEKCVVHVIFLGPRNGIVLTRIQPDWWATCRHASRDRRNPHCEQCVCV